MVKEVSDFYVETKTKKTNTSLEVLQHQTDSVRRALNSALMNVAVSGDATPNLNLARQILRVPSQQKQVDVQANQAILLELVRNLETTKMLLMKETPLIQIIDRPILPLIKNKPDMLISFLKGLFITSFLFIGYIIFRRITSELLK